MLLPLAEKLQYFFGVFLQFQISVDTDLLCWENGLSVIENPKPSPGSYGTWLGEKPPIVRGRLEGLIDDALRNSCKNFDNFLAAMKAAGAEVKWGKHLAFKIPGGKRFIRCDSLGEDYFEAAILERISGKRSIVPKQKQAAPNLLIDVQAKLQQAHSPGFERWARMFNLKEMAKTLNYLQEHGLMAYANLESACDTAVQKYNGLSDHTKANNARMKEISELQKHIGAYAKTRQVYTQYRRLPLKKQAQFYNEHASEIISCEAAKRHFDSLGLKKLPPIQTLKQEYAALLAENKKLYPKQKQAKSDMMELLTVKSNIDRILGKSSKSHQKSRQQEER